MTKTKRRRPKPSLTPEQAEQGVSRKPPVTIRTRRAVDSCTSCNGGDRVYAFRLGPQDQAGLVIRLCLACRAIFRDACAHADLS